MENRIGEHPQPTEKCDVAYTILENWPLIVVADFTQNNQTDFVVSQSTFSSLAITDKGPRLLKSGIIDIEYKMYTEHFFLRSLLIVQ
jgi:hypothetical protein